MNGETKIKKNEVVVGKRKKGICEICGSEVTLYGAVNRCECGVKYDKQGNQLSKFGYFNFGKAV